METQRKGGEGRSAEDGGGAKLAREPAPTATQLLQREGDISHYLLHVHQHDIMNSMAACVLIAFSSSQ